MKKVAFAICFCWVFFWCPYAQGTMIQPWPDPPTVFEEDLVDFLIYERCQTLGQSSIERDFSTSLYDSQEIDIYRTRMLMDFMEVFSRAEIESPVVPFSRVDKEYRDRKEISLNTNGLFLDSNRQEPGIEEPSLQWLVFVVGLAFFSGGLMFRFIPMGPGVFLLVIWLFFWQLFIRAFIATVSFVDAILQRM